MIGIPNPIYSRRKRFLPEYRELFTALFNIPDKDVRDRVTDAVNGTQKCSVCKQKVEFRNFSTQTETLSETVPSVMDIKETTLPNQGTTERRRRKRKRNCPKVVKTAQHSSTTPVLQQDSPPNNSDKIQQPAKIRRSNSGISTNFEDTILNVWWQTGGTNVLRSMCSDTPEQSAELIEYIKKTMKDEWVTCETYSSAGLLPIHEAIVQNEVQKLKRQLYVWNHRKVNLMGLLTEDGDNPLQLAIKENCLKSIIDELLKQNMQLNDLDVDCNTIIHLAVAHLTCDDMQQHKEPLDSLESILKKVDLQMLLEQNDDGLTVLHVAVKNNKYLMVETILKVVDERLNLSSVVPLNDTCADQKKFTSYYCRQCDSFEGRQQNEQKNKILNATDMKGGCTALFFAMEMRYEHLVYLLMAHMCNPNIKNLSGLDAKTYYTEHVQDKSPQIIGALEAVSAVLQN